MGAKALVLLAMAVIAAVAYVLASRWSARSAAAAPFPPRGIMAGLAVWALIFFMLAAFWQTE